jgi:protein-S-isoprenylcysteine O-methyltransferase Ste14
MNTRRAVPDRASVRIFPPAAPLATIVAGLILDRVVPLGPDLRAPFRVLGGVIVLGAVSLLGAWSVLLVRRSGQSENPWKPTTGVIQTGPFSRTRNPMYLQMVIGCIGFALLLSKIWIVLLTPVCAVLLHTLAIRPEEAYLERKFGTEYRAYKARVRRWV